MAAPTVTLYDNLLKTVYPDERFVDETIQQCKTWGRIKEDRTFEGKSMTLSIPYGGNDGGIGATIATAQAGLSGTDAAEMVLTRKTKFGVSRIDRELLDIAATKRGAFVDALEQETFESQERFRATLGSSVFGDGGGSIGQIKTSSGVTTATITLTNPADVIHFRPNMIICASAADGNSGSLRSGSATVASVNRVAGTVTATLHWDDVISGIADLDYLFPQGAFGANPSGFAAWCPLTVGTHLGFDCTVAPEELAGVRDTADGGSVEDALIRFAFLLADMGRKTKQIILSNTLASTLVREQGTRSQYIRTDSSKVQMGASDLKLVLPSAEPIEIITDCYCQTLTAWFVDLSQWRRMSSPSGAPHMQKSPGGDLWFPVATENQIELRQAAYYNFRTFSPRNIGRLTFS